MKSSQGHVKSVIGCWAHLGTTSIYTKEKMSSDHGVWGPQKTYFKAYIIYWHGPRVLLWERQKRCYGRKMQGPMVEKYSYNQFLINFFYGEEEMKTKKRQKYDQIWFFFQKCPFWTYIKKSTHSLFGAWSFLLVHIQFTPSEGLEAFVNWSFKKSDHGIWAMKSDHRKRPSSMVRLHNTWCKPTLCFGLFSSLLL